MLAELPGWAKCLAAADRDGTAECVVRLTPGQQDFLACHGPYGQTLAGQTQAGNPDAVYQAALLLGTSPAHRDDAITLLFQAAAAGHLAAASLLDTSPGHIPAFSAACSARARKAEADRSHDQAQAFRQAAARDSTASDPTTVTGHDTVEERNGADGPCH